MSPVVNPSVAFINLVYGAQERCSSQGDDDGQHGSPLGHPGGQIWKSADGSKVSPPQLPQVITNTVSWTTANVDTVRAQTHPRANLDSRNTLALASGSLLDRLSAQA